MGVTPRPVADRFWAKVNKNGPISAQRPDLGPCWIWTGGIVHNGYGRFAPTKRGKKIKAHTWAYVALVGPVPEGKELDHLCRTPPCVNPSHLEPVTHRENLLRGNSITAICAKKTHCPQGHEYTAENTQRDRAGDRRCRICRQRQDRNRRVSRNAAQVPA